MSFPTTDGQSTTGESFRSSITCPLGTKKSTTTLRSGHHCCRPLHAKSETTTTTRRRMALTSMVAIMMLLFAATTTTSCRLLVGAFTTTPKTPRALLLQSRNPARAAAAAAAASTVFGRRSASRLTRLSSSPSSLSTSTTVPASATTTTTTTKSTDDVSAPPPPPAKKSAVLIGKKRLATAMAFLTGWADMVLNVRLGTFCSMMTGNLLWMLRAVAEVRFVDGLYYGTVMAAYCAGLVTYRKWQLRDQSMSSASSSPSSILPTVAGAVAVLFVAADILLSQTLYPHKFVAKWLPACLLSAGFAMANGVGSDTAGSMTFVITGHLTKLTTAVVDDRHNAAAAAAHDTGRSSSIIASWGETWQRLRQQPGLATNLFSLLGFMGGAVFANALRLSSTASFLLQKSSVGEFAWIGMLFGGLFLWKHSLETQPSQQQQPLQPWKQYAKQLIRNCRRRPLPFGAQSNDDTLAVSASSTSSTMMEDNAMAPATPILTAWKGTEYYGEDEMDLLDSTFAADLIPTTVAAAAAAADDHDHDSASVPSTIPTTMAINAKSTTTSAILTSLEDLVDSTTLEEWANAYKNSTTTAQTMYTTTDGNATEDAADQPSKKKKKNLSP